MQQDAEECWSQLISTLKAKLPPHVEGKENVVAQFMQGEFTSTYVLLGSRRAKELQSLSLIADKGLFFIPTHFFCMNQVEVRRGTRGRSNCYCGTYVKSGLPYLQW